MSSSGFNKDDYSDDSNNELSGDVEIGPDGLPVSKTSNEKMNEEPVNSEATPEQPLRRVRRFATIMNLLNSLLGAGILSVPSSFTNAGIIPSVLLLLFIAVLSYIGTAQVIKLQLDTKSDGYDALVLVIAGKIGSIIYSILNLIFLILAMLSYIVLGGDMLISWFSLTKLKVDTLMSRALVILIYSFAIPVLLTIPRNITILSYFSTATVFCIILFVIAMIIKGGIYFKSNKINSTCVNAKFDLSVFYAISIYGLSFSLPAVTPPVIHEYNTNYHKRKIVAISAIVLCFILVIIPALFGYLMFGEKTEGNVLKNFPDDDTFIIIIRAAFFLVVSFSYPCVAQAVMCSWSQLIYKNNFANQLPASKRIVILILTNIVPILVGMFLPQAKPALGIGGALGGCIVDFAYPPILWIMYYKLKCGKVYVLCVIFAIFGFVTAGISTYEGFVDAIDAFKKAK